MRQLSASVLWENDTYEEAQAIVQWVVEHGGKATLNHLTQVYPALGDQFQVTITETDTVYSARPRSIIAYYHGRFFVE